MEMDKLLVRYYRLSLEDLDAEESNSIGNQRELIKDYVETHDDLNQMDTLELYDDGYTGTNFNRPGIKKFFELLKKNRIGCLIVKDFSRFTRDYIELGSYVEQIFPFMEIRFISVNDHYDSKSCGSSGGLEIPFKGILNDLYSRDISLKVKAAKGQMIREGRLCSGSYPFGYRKRKAADRTGCPYEVDELAAETVRFIFEQALAGRKNIEIARSLNEKGCLTPGMYKRKNGAAGYGLKEGDVSVWDSAKVLNILRDERYAGTLIVGRYQGMGIGSGKVKQLPEDKWVRRENGVPALVSKETFEQVQAMHPVRKRGEYTKKHHILYRKVRCGCCGHFLYYKPSDSGAEYHSFFCKQPRLKSDSQCFRGYIKERDILNMLLRVIKTQTKMAKELGKSAKREAGKTKQKMAERQLRQLKQELESMKMIKVQSYKAYRAGELSKEDFQKKKADLKKANFEKQQKLGELQRILKKLETDNTEFVQCFGQSTQMERLNREIIERLVDVVWVYDTERVKVDLKYCEKL